MTKILIVNSSFGVGGIQSSMINMANELAKYYEVHIFAYNPTGVLKSRLDSRVKILESSALFKALGMPIGEALQTRDLKIIAFRLFSAVWSKLFDNRFPIQIAIKHQPAMIGYDLAIAYRQEHKKKTAGSGFARVVDQCVQAKKKVVFLHFDSRALDLDSAYNNKWYQKMDKLVFVSKALMEHFVEQYPAFQGKTEYCYNFMLYDQMKQKSLEPMQKPFEKDRFVCFSACRLSEEKAIPRFIRATADVFKAHPDLMWYIAGDGSERDRIEQEIQMFGLETQIILLGNQTNPYPYMRGAQLVMNVSYHEAAPMVFLESLALGTPVFATRTSSVNEFIEDHVNSFVCENDEQSIHDAFQMLLSNRLDVVRVAETLASYKASNERSLQMIREWIEE